MSWGLLPEVATDSSLITRDTLPPNNAQFYINGTDTRIFLNVNNSITSVGTTTFPMVDLNSGVTGILPVAKGGTGQDTAQEAIDALLPSQTGKSGKFLSTDGTNSSWAGINVLSNVIFNFCATDNTAARLIVSSVLTDVTASGLYSYWATMDNPVSWKTVLSTKWEKISGVSTITIWCRIWTDSAVTGNAAKCLVNIGGATGSVAGTANQVTPEWKSFTVDVSGLTNGTAYDILVQTSNTGVNKVTYLDTAIGIAS